MWFEFRMVRHTVMVSSDDTTALVFQTPIHVLLVVTSGLFYPPRLSTGSQSKQNLHRGVPTPLLTVEWLWNFSQDMS